MLMAREKKEIVYKREHVFRHKASKLKAENKGDMCHDQIRDLQEPSIESLSCDIKSLACRQSLESHINSWSLEMSPS